MTSEQMIKFDNKIKMHRSKHRNITNGIAVEFN